MGKNSKTKIGIFNVSASASVAENLGHNMLDLVENSVNRVDYPKAQSINQIFEEQVTRTPDATALIFGKEQLSYQELNKRANQLAHYLKNAGVEPEILVGICVERSAAMIVGILGILKTGASYVPLDPSYPKNRLDYMLEDSQTPVIVTQQNILDKLGEHSAKFVCLDSDWERISKESSENPEASAKPENTAYIIYTSGSTGKPKGVMITQGNLVNYVHSLTPAIGLQSDDRYLHTASISFSSSVRQMILPLSIGATLVIATTEKIANPLPLFEFIKHQNVSVLDFVPSYWRSCLDAFENISEDKRRDLLNNNLRLILSASEPLPADVPQKLTEKLNPQVRMINMYGQTETTGIVFVYPIEKPFEIKTKTVPIGRPISNIQAYILNENLLPVPISVEGELYISGDGLGRGYLNLPELTQEQFIKNPFDEKSKLYKTGDLARFLPTGEIEHLGRADDQVKIRGFRIETAEIETLLLRISGIKQCVVTAREFDSGDKKLVAYFTANKDFNVSDTDLRNHLKQQLPDYMMPSAFVELDALPLTPNGKINRQALPSPQSLKTFRERDFVAPRDEIEAKLTAIWEEVLCVKPIGVTDEFFNLGGDSLQAARIFVQIEKIIGKTVSHSVFFGTGTIEKLAELIRQSDDSEEKTKRQPIPKATREQALPMSFAQQRIWFLDQLEPDSSLYNVAEAVRLQGVLDVQSLQKSFNALVAHHEILRTRYAFQDGNPVQIIGQPLPFDLQIIDLQQFTGEEKESKLRELMRQERKRPFNLASDLMIRASLFKLAPQENVLLLVIHHIATDGWSTKVIWKQLTRAYQAFLENKPNPLPELPIQYADFAIWQKEWLKKDLLNRQLAYWKKQLEEIPLLLELPTDRPRPPVQSYRGSNKYFYLSQSLTDSLEQFCRQEGVTLYMTLLAAFQTLLHRYGGQKDIVIGSPIAGRNRFELEELVGCFVNTLVMRTNFSENPEFRELLSQVRSVTLEAFANQDVPFEKLVEELQPERSLQYNPLFQVMFVLQNTPERNEKIFGLDGVSPELERDTARFDISLFLSKKDGKLAGIWEYNTDLFDSATIDRLTGHFQTLLEKIVINPQSRIGDLEFLTETERNQILIEWNANELEFAPEKAIHHLIEKQTKLTPEAVAVVDSRERLTYRELNEKANKIAHYLQNLGVLPESLIGVCLTRSTSMVAAILGILKSGGAYLPLDPAYPSERLAYMLDDSQASIVLTEEQYLGQFNQDKVQPICLDRDWEQISLESAKNPASAVRGENLAYLIYTSGSTGKPKGVMIEHRNATAFLAWAQTVYTEEELRGVLFSTSVCFDLSVYEMFLPLSCGGTVLVVENLLHLPQLPSASEVTLINTVPSAIAELLRMKGVPASVRIVNLAGEPLKTALVREIYQLGQIEKVYDLYGPSEDTTYSTYTLRDLERATIGRPIANTQAYILDKYLQPVPTGIAGELYLSGAGLARGYLNREELTRERFVANPFNSEASRRMYRTGDLVRYLTTGEIEYLGRIDNQVKIRGFRIELGEIEARMVAHPQITEAIVIAREEDDGSGKYLAAYFVKSKTEELKIGELREFLKEILPDYMIPSVFVELPEMPLTPNGKIDRKKLPAPEKDSFVGDESYLAGRDEIERKLVEIWEEILAVRPIGVRDNFFELGGHSLKAIRMFGEVEETFGKSIPIATLFQAGTIEQLAEILRQEGWSEPESSIVPIKPEGEKPPFFCFHGGGGDVLFYRDLAVNMTIDAPFYGVRAMRLGGRQVGHATVEEMAAYYIKEIQKVQPEGPYYLGGSSLGGSIALEVAQQFLKKGQKTALLALFDTRGPGYPQLLPSVSTFRSKIYALAHRVKNHIDKLNNLNTRGKFEYFITAVKKLKQRVTRKVRNNYKKAVRKIYFKLERPLPENFIQIEDQILKASRKYVQKDYPGKIILFRATTQPLGIVPDPTLGWGKLSLGGLEIHEVSGDHVSIVGEPHVPVLAEILCKCIESAYKDSSQLSKKVQM